MVIRKINANGCHFLGAHRLSVTALANDDDDDDDDWHEIEHILRAQKYNEEREGRSGESSVVNERFDDAHNYQETEAQLNTRKATWGSPISIREARGSTDKLLDSEEERTIFSDEAEMETLEKEMITDKAGLIFNASRKRKTACNGSTSGLDVVIKKAKKRPVNVWTKTSSRKGSKKNSKNGSAQVTPAKVDCVLLTPVLRNQDKIEDGPGLPVLLSKIHKAERVELSSDRLSAGSTKGYRMVRATRGVTDGAWYFEITVEKLGPTGHTRLGWSTQKADVQAPVGFDTNSYAYRDLEGSKVHKATREPYGESYGEGDVIGFYINLPRGAELAPNPPEIVCYKGRPYLVETKEEPAQQIVPGSEIVFFRNGVCQGTAYQDIIAGCYFPAASMYTLPDQPNCTVKFCFGPDFKFPPTDLGQRPIPQAMCFAPHCGRTTQELGSPGELDISQTSELKK